jgi:hypothetical protein
MPRRRADRRVPMQQRLLIALASAWLPLAAWSQQSIDDTEASAQTAPATRPAIRSNRWQEDWSSLADPAMRTQAFDSLKYIALGPDAYASLGLNLRERFESNDEPAFGIGRDGDAYLLQRLQLHADIRIADHWQLFTQVEDARAEDKKAIGPADENPLDLRMAFVAYVTTLGDGVLKARVGRQDFAFDLQRFVSLRDGPNLRQSFDAAWINYELAPWRFIAFASHPVQYQHDEHFDDTSNRHFAFHTLRVERQVLGGDELSAYYSRYELDDSSFPDAAGNERRNILDVRFAGTEGAVDWDVEAMGQQGHVGSAEARAWAFGGRGGYRFQSAPWTPRLGVQLDIASGDRHAGDGRLQTFNPLFPNGYYFALAGYTGYANLIHIKPSLTVKPNKRLAVTGAVGLLWRQTTGDAVYVQPDVPLADTAGQRGRWTGIYAQLRTDWTINPNLLVALEAVHYEVGDTVRRAGGADSDYLELELKFSW